MRTYEQVARWVGRDALDADGHRVGMVLGVQRDGTGAPSGLEIGDAGSDPSLVLALDGCEETGTAIRLPIADGSAARRQPWAGKVTSDVNLTAHDPDADVIEGLHEAYALEGEGLARLEALAAAFEDAELQHRFTMHKAETTLHRTGVEERLKALELTPRKQVSLGAPLPSGLGPVELIEDAVAFERHEAEFYAELEAAARACGDTATADLAATHRADELAAADGLAAEITRIASP